MSEEPVYGVISGDVIDSIRFEGPDVGGRFQELFHGALDRVQSMFYDALVFDQVETFQWDSFQTVVSRPGVSLRISLNIYLELLQCDLSIPSRISLGLGAVEDPVDQRAGEAFRLSGRGLEEIKRGERFSLEFPNRVLGTEARLGWKSAAQFLSSVMRSWNPRQARALTGWLKRYTQEEIARTIPPRDSNVPDDHVSQQYVSKLLKQARGRPVRNMVENFEQVPFCM